MRKAPLRGCFFAWREKRGGGGQSRPPLRGDWRCLVAFIRRGGYRRVWRDTQVPPYGGRLRYLVPFNRAGRWSVPGRGRSRAPPLRWEVKPGSIHPARWGAERGYGAPGRRALRRVTGDGWHAADGVDGAVQWRGTQVPPYGGGLRYLVPFNRVVSLPGCGPPGRRPLRWERCRLPSSGVGGGRRRGWRDT